MNNKQFTDLLEKVIIPKVQETRQSGGQEYARSDDNIFANFERVSKQLGNTVEDCIMTYTLKHIDGIISHINGEISQREDVRGRITDVIVYLSLLWAYFVKDENMDIPEGAYLKKEEDTNSTPAPEFESLGFFPTGKNEIRGEKAIEMIAEAQKAGAATSAPKIIGPKSGQHHPNQQLKNEQSPINRQSCCGEKRRVNQSNINREKAKEKGEL